MDRKLIITEDGSHSLYVPELQESFHSSFGAIQESQCIFIEAGLYPLFEKQADINILEIGLGTGLNALLTCIDSEHKQCKVNYTGIEAFPIEKEIYQQLNFGNFLDSQNAADILLQLHETAWNMESILSPYFTFKKIHAGLEDSFFPDSYYDLIYFDAFAPDVQPEMWTEKQFDKLYKTLKPRGVLVTYSCKGIVKRTLKALGFTIEKLPGPKGKREFLRAVKL